VSFASYPNPGRFLSWLVPRNPSRFHATDRSLSNQVQLITYVDRLTGDLKQLKEDWTKHGQGFLGVYICFLS
jgi:hypothetical protein